MSSSEPSSDFASALADCDQALMTLEKAVTPSADEVLAVLMRRDRLQERFPAKPSAQEVIQLIGLDNRLRKQASIVNQVLTLDHYRTSLNTKPTAWWWYLEPGEHHLDRFDWIWQALTLILLTPSVSIIVDVSSRFLGNGPDALGAFAVVTQSAIALATGGALTEPGRKIIQSVLASLRIPLYLWKETQALLSLLLLLGLLGFRASLPSIARNYAALANEQRQQGQLALAEENYQRSLKLWPTNIECYENLGLLYEDLNDLDQAKKHYALAVEAGSPQAHNNLARLYNLEGKYDRAFHLLWLGLTHPNVKQAFDDPVFQAIWYKNLGWARQGQARYDEAEGYLSIAIDLANQSATANDDDQPKNTSRASATQEEALSAQGAAYCLRAQVFAAQGKTAQLPTEWQRCLQYANPSLPEEDRWIGMAQAYQRTLQTSTAPANKPVNDQ